MSSALVLVLGGAASGKSKFSENLIVRSGLPRRYIATSRIWDDEMAAKKMRHVAQRGPDWDTIEAQLDVTQPISDWPAPGAVLIDCATMWLTNHVMDEADIPKAQARFIAALAQPGCLRVVVSNELGQGIVPADALSRRFRQLQGELNQQIAAIADTVVFVTAGVPQVLKGSL